MVDSVRLTSERPAPVARRPLLRRRVLRVSLAIVGVLALGGAVWGAVAWARYPKVPNVAKVELPAAIDFMASDDFGKMSESHRKRYALSVIEKLREKSFKDLIALIMGSANNPVRRLVVQNVMKLMSEKDKEELAAATLRMFLDKFYELPTNERENYMTLWALGEKAGGMMGGRGQRGGTTRPTTRPAPGFPTAAQVEKQWSKFLSRQSPRTAAQMGQLMNDMRKKRQALGVKDPWG